MIRLGMCNEMFEGWPLEAVCAFLREVGYEGIELAPFTLAPRITDLKADDRRTIRAKIEDSGLACIGLHWLLAKTEGFHLTSPEAETRRATADYLRELAIATYDLGGTIMVLGSPKQRDLLPGVSFDQAMGHAAAVLAAVGPTLSDTGVTLCVEPLTTAETNFLVSIDEANELIDRLSHPFVKLQIDAKAQFGDANGGTVADLWRRHGASAAHAHANDPNLRGPGMGDLDFNPLGRALIESGYSGWWSVEPFDYSPGAAETARRSYRTLRDSLST